MAPAPHTFHPVELEDGNPYPYIYNVTLYDIQSLPPTEHTLKLSLVNWVNSTTTINFDYAYVNGTAPSLTPSTSSVPSHLQ